MKNEWKNIDETTRNRLEEALDQREMNSKPYSQEWFEVKCYTNVVTGVANKI